MKFPAFILLFGILLVIYGCTSEKPKEQEIFCYEYAPAIDFYEIVKRYHLNGMIKERGKYMCGLKFGKWEYFDEKGNLIRIKDEDAKFKGVKVTREDVLKILETEGWFDRKTGKGKLLEENRCSVDGAFYQSIKNNMHVRFISTISEGKNENLSLWSVSITIEISGVRHGTYYIINAHTGEYIMEKTHVTLLI